MTKTQIDKLGERLRRGNTTENDLRLLDIYRRSYGDVYERIVGTIRMELALEPTGRPAKSTTALIEKLRRESIRLTQVQDIAGCRLIVTGIVDQDRAVRSLTELFVGATVVDRRIVPSHGYRAVHVVVFSEEKAFEIQVRTAMQHQWAELSEKFADLLDPAIKYGGGEEQVRSVLARMSGIVADAEQAEIELAKLTTQVQSLESLPESLQESLIQSRNRQDEMNRQISELFSETLLSLEGRRGT